jgi:hypothetical protein
MVIKGFRDRSNLLLFAGCNWHFSLLLESDMVRRQAGLTAMGDAMDRHYFRIN